MRIGLAAVACLVCLAGAGAQAGDLRLRRAVLTQGGVGTFEYEAAADPGGIVTLNVRRGDVDDVLKSLAVLGGAARVSGLRLAGPDGAAAAFAALPFPATAMAQPLALMNALRGVPIEVRDLSGREIVLTGRMMGAVRDREPAAGTREGVGRTRVTLLTDTGLRQFVLEESGAIRVADPLLQARLDTALAALQGQAAGDRRAIRLQVEGASAEPVRIAVVTATPLWKPTYRLVLPEAGQTTARLQAWAVLENATAGDWDEVSVTLQSGNPVTFRQRLYEPVLVDRPEVAVDQQRRPLPQIDAAPAAPMAMAAPAPEQLMPMARVAKLAPPAAPAAVSEGIASTSFELPTKVSLAVGETASLPFLDVQVPAESLDLLEDGQVNPLAALRMTNATGSGLPGGAVATFEGASFSGDALLPALPAGERRVLTFAQDLAVTARWDHESDQDVTGLTVAGGVAHLVRLQRTITRIELTGAALQPRTVLIAIPRVENATLTATGATLSEQTPTTWRLLVGLRAGEHAVVTATADQPAAEDVALTDDPGAVLTLLNLRVLSPQARAAIERIAGLRREEALHTDERDRLATRRTEIGAEEQRLRDNLAAVPTSDPLHARLLRQLDASETTLQDLAAKADRATEAARVAHEALVAAIAALSIKA